MEETDQSLGNKMMSIQEIFDTEDEIEVQEVEEDAECDVDDDSFKTPSSCTNKEISAYLSSDSSNGDLSIIWEEASCDLLDEELSYCSLLEESTTETERSTSFSPDDRWGEGVTRDVVPTSPVHLDSRVGRRRGQSIIFNDDFTVEDDESRNGSLQVSLSMFDTGSDEVRRFRSTIDSFSSTSKSESRSISSRETCATVSMSDEAAESSWAGLSVSLIPLFHLVDFKKVVEIPVDGDFSKSSFGLLQRYSD
jgi:hypothetical protein